MSVLACAVCSAPALGQGTYPWACLEHALALANVDRTSRNRQEARTAFREAFRGSLRHLKALGPVRGAQGPVSASLENSPMDPDTFAAVVTLMGVGATPVRTERRYGTLPPGVAPLTEAHDPLQPCAQCGTTSTRIARAPYGVGGNTVWVLCKAADACRARAGKAKAA